MPSVASSTGSGALKASCAMDGDMVKPMPAG
jgi:hypothetical protein